MSEGGRVLAVRHCWWCGQSAEVDTELPESGGLVRDTETSWLCVDGKACAERGYHAVRRPISCEIRPETPQ